MKKDIEKLKNQLIQCLDRAQVFMEKYDMGKATKEQRRALKIYNNMISYGKEGMDAILEIAESDHYQAAIFCCTQAYDLHPRKCRNELKRISKSGKSLTASIARGMMNMLSMGIRFDEPPKKKWSFDFTDTSSPDNNLLS